MRFRDKIIVVTGASSGIGQAIATYFVSEGAQVVLCARKELKKEVIQLLNSKSIGKAYFVECDVRNKASVQSLMNFVNEKFGKIDVLVNNAGIFKGGDVVSITEEDWDDVIASNLKSVFLCSKEFVPLMRKNGGSIINISSYYGLLGGKQAAAYCAAKAGVVNLTRAMALDYARESIKVNVVCPGPVDTQLLRSSFSSQESFKKLSVQNPMGRIGTPEEIAQVVSFLAEEKSSYITGAVIAVDGGGSAGIRII